MKSRRVMPMGERAVLIETSGAPDTLGLLAALHAAPLRHQLELVPGARTLLVRFSDPVRPGGVASLLPPVGTAAGAPPEGQEVTIEVVYDGPDLDEVADLTGLGPDGIVTAHTMTPWRVAFCGFSPGFGYLTGGDPRLLVPRRDTPRKRVPAGSVGLAGEYSGVYPSASPGGWQLIGRTAAALWDIDRDPPALLRPGTTVRFRATRQVVTGSSPARPARPAPSSEHPTPKDAAACAGRALVVHGTGMQCTIQDLGRTGVADLGVSPSGAADRSAAMRANRIVGGEPTAAVLEILLGGAEFQARGDLLLAVTGAPIPIEVRGAAGDPVAVPDAAMDRPIPVPADARIRLGRPPRGLRSYLAVRGGIAVAPVLGGRCTDLLSGIGPPAVRPGDVLPVGETHWGMPHPLAGAGEDAGVPTELSVLPGPQLDWFAPGTLERMCAATWTVSPASNRVGVRLTGPDLSRVRQEELPSQGLVRGAVQVPPSGELVVLLSDHPVTGGYPVVAVLTEKATDLAAQARPGATVRLHRSG